MDDDDHDHACGHHPSMVTIIHLSAAPNCLVGPPKVALKGYNRYVYFSGGVGGDPKSFKRMDLII